MNEMRFLPAGEQGLVIELGNTIDAQINRQVHRLARTLTEQDIDGVLEIIPTYRSLLVYFDPLKLSRQMLIDLVESISATMTSDNETVEQTGRVVTIPVCYGGDFGPDLDFVAKHNQLTADEVIKIHTSTPYQVYMLGFTPGFPYLGGMSEKIATPRLEKPRVKIPAGSVGIAGSQTGFYPIDSPGGWQLIGRTPIKGFAADNTSPFAFAAGDYLQFTAISTTEFNAICTAVAAGDYRPMIATL